MRVSEENEVLLLVKLLQESYLNNIQPYAFVLGVKSNPKSGAQTKKEPLCRE